MADNAKKQPAETKSTHTTIMCDLIPRFMFNSISQFRIYCYICIGNGSGRFPLCDIFLMKRFLLILNQKFAKFFYSRIAVVRRSCLSYIHSPTRGIEITMRRGSGLYITVKAFGDASD